MLAIQTVHTKVIKAEKTQKVKYCLSLWVDSWPELGGKGGGFDPKKNPRPLPVTPLKHMAVSQNNPRRRLQKPASSRTEPIQADLQPGILSTDVCFLPVPTTPPDFPFKKGTAERASKLGQRLGLQEPHVVGGFEVLDQGRPQPGDPLLGYEAHVLDPKGCKDPWLMSSKGKKADSGV